MLRVITRLNIGGPSIQAVTLSARLAPFGFDTTLVHGRLGEAEGDMSYLLAGTEVDARHLPSLQRPLAPVSDAVALVRLYRLMCAVRPSIVHTHMAKAGSLGRLAAALYNATAGRRRPAKLVHTYHGHVLDGYFAPSTTNVFIRVERALARVTDRIVAISPRIQADLLALGIGVPTRYVVIPLGFDLEALARVTAADRAAARAALEIPAEAPVVTTVGRLTAIKQHDLFLDAARHIVSRRPDAVCLIAGDGELRPTLERRVEALGLGGHVRFLGWRRDLATVYGATDVFALTSRNEGTPVALIEAMAAGVPGVSTDVGGVADVLTTPDIGTRVPFGDAEAFARAVEAIFESPERHAMGERARQSVLTRFGIDRLVADVAHLYKVVLTE